MFRQIIVDTLMYNQNLNKRQVHFLEKVNFFVGGWTITDSKSILLKRFPHKVSDEFIKSLNRSYNIYQVYLHKNLASKLTNDQINIMVLGGNGWWDVMERGDWKLIPRNVMMESVERLINDYYYNTLANLYKVVDSDIKEGIMTLIHQEWGGADIEFFYEKIKETDD